MATIPKPVTNLSNFRMYPVFEYLVFGHSLYPHDISINRKIDEFLTDNFIFKQKLEWQNNILGSKFENRKTTNKC